MAATIITSEQSIPIDTIFRVSAGPGAGKTHWLIRHIEDVLHQPSKLGKMGKVACITYTNVGKDTVMGRISAYKDKIEVCTIHSFLYNYIVKPYLHFIAEEEGFNISLLVGDDDRVLTSYSVCNEIVHKSKSNYINSNNFSTLTSAIKNIKWVFGNNGELECKIQDKWKYKIGRYSIKDNICLIYKKIAWREGVMHYDDVMYFAYRLVSKYPFLLKVIVHKFPYCFIDEFQDSTPIQVNLIKKIGQAGAVVGVIGDSAQSIYGFTGVSPALFNAFKIKGIKDYQIEDNHRSSRQIIDLLNTIRIDLKQNCTSGIKDGALPRILVGEKYACYERSKLLSNDDVYALTYRNVDANLMKEGSSTEIIDGHLIDKIEDVDYDRSRLIANFIKAIEHARVGDFKKAGDLFKIINIPIKYIPILTIDLLKSYDTYSGGSVSDFYKYINETFQLGGTGLRKGKAMTFYEKHTYKDLALCVSPEGNEGEQRTIHKSKGDEFDNVCLFLSKEESIEFLIRPQLNENESHRVYYVALSRAKRNLFISVPTLSKEREEQLKKLPLEIVYIKGEDNELF